MKGRKPTADEKRYMSEVVSLGCVICHLFYSVESPAAIHHCDGRTKPDAHYKILPLCAGHHQVSSPSGEWATRHAPGRNAGKFAFESAYGSEESLMEKVRGMVNYDNA